MITHHTETPHVNTFGGKLIPIQNCIKILSFFTLLFYSSFVLGQSADIDQVRNGSATSRISPANWVNGNAGPENAHYAEGYSIPYRMRIAGLVGNANTTHTLIIEWDTKDQNGHAIDYITHYFNLDNPVGSHQQTFGHVPETIDPTIGTAFSGAPTLFQILAPSSTGAEVAGQPTTSFNNLPTAQFTNKPDITKMAIWGGTITGMTYVFQQAPDGNKLNASTKTQLSIQFKSANGSTALLAWAGHIAAEYDWGPGRGATGVSGSPYHMRLISIDGKGGNQDRSLKASAVIIPPPVCGISPAQTACPETPSLTFHATGSSTGLNISYQWTLTNGNTSAGAKISGSSTGFDVTVVPIGTAFLVGGTFNLSLTVNKTGAQSTTCNQTPAGTIERTIVTATADPTTIDITSAAHNTTLTADIDPASTDPNNANYTYLWEITSAGALGTLSNANQRIATYTAEVGDVSVTFKVTATQVNDNNPLTAECSDDSTVSVTVTRGSTCDVSPQGPVCQGSTTTHNGSPSPKPVNATYTWSLQGIGGSGSTTSTLASANGGVNMQVNANSSYRIVITQTYSNPALNTSCFEDVTVIPTPSFSHAFVAPMDCGDAFFEVTVTNTKAGVSYSIDQPNNNKDFSAQSTVAQSDNQTITFTGLIPGDGYVVTGTASIGDVSCPHSESCTQNPGVLTTAANTNSPKEEIAKKPDEVNIALESGTKATAAPNPYSDRIRFNLVSGVSGKGTLELYNMLGQKVATVYDGYFQAGREISKDYNVPIDKRTNFIYVFRVGEQRVSGKLFGLNKK